MLCACASHCVRDKGGVAARGKSTESYSFVQESREIEEEGACRQHKEPLPSAIKEVSRSISRREVAKRKGGSRGKGVELITVLELECETACLLANYCNKRSR